MKKDNVGGVPGNILGMLADLMHKLQHGTITPDELGKFLQIKNPYLDRKNRPLSSYPCNGMFWRTDRGVNYQHVGTRWDDSRS